MSFTLLSESKPIARNTHKCVWCAESILKGEKYYYRTYKFEGLQSDKAHLDCDTAMKLIDWHYHDEGFESGQHKRGLPVFKNGDEYMLRERAKPPEPITFKCNGALIIPEPPLFI